MNTNNIRYFVDLELLKTGVLSRGLNCAMPDNAAYTLAVDIASKLGENTSTNSFNNFIDYYNRLRSAYSFKHKGIHNLYKDAGFDVHSLEMEMNNAIDELLKTQTSSCYTKRPDVVDRIKNFYSELLKNAINKTGIKSAAEPASEPASEPAAESAAPESGAPESGAPESAAPESEPSAEGGKKKKGGKKSAKKQTKNLCLKKSTQKKSTKKSTKGKSKCESVKGCKVASGSKRTYCRKAHNKTHKKK